MRKLEDALSDEGFFMIPEIIKPGAEVLNEIIL